MALPWHGSARINANLPIFDDDSVRIGLSTAAMTGAMNRRSILKGGIAAGAALVLPARAVAQPDPLVPDPLVNAFDQAFPGRAAPTVPAEEVIPAGPPPFTGNSPARTSSGRAELL